MFLIELDGYIVTLNHFARLGGGGGGGGGVGGWGGKGVLRW